MSDSPYRITDIGRTFVASEEFRQNVRTLWKALEGQGKTRDEILEAAFVYAAQSLLMDGGEEMEIDIGRMRAFVSENREAIRNALQEALPPFAR